ncbi:phosphoribosylformylglycinamidine cyclo-ligase [Flaviflexus salsibiostraticola]|uniref:Phosphoribosylformylglycinamidine cyclo-ligase n=1 Tax=Flaviflexus salsibiostraticola TaxID=1282737 RepID=A0A3S8Z9X2_9ACTO|nr:phosphoribosylformylglycinamidine cyclo-ligase [Flaviflexus salsibiostraticola]AZN30086.1 phosphoribosylformylglycinamidine cyclo-ligase [Flaviflexus salsibiostraticola]
MKITYSQAGVDTEAGDRAVELMKSAVARTHGPAVVGGVGGFAGLLDASALLAYRKPYLATSTDGVGTKVAIAQALDIHDTIGQDLVGMVVDDIVVVGAKPLLMTDYIACGKVVPERIADIVRGIADACASINTPLLGGETAEHPGLLGENEYDVAGAATGVVEADAVLGPERVREGDVIIAMASSGIHSNGYSLVRKVLEVNGWDYTKHVDDLGRTIGEELLVPTRLYTNVCLEVADRAHAFCHVTGGGLAANLARVLPQGLLAEVQRWEVPPIFKVIADLGGVPTADLEGTLNLGIGMLAILPQEHGQAVIDTCVAAGIPAWEAGRVLADDGGQALRGAKGVQGGGVRLTGQYAGL